MITNIILLATYIFLSKAPVPSNIILTHLFYAQDCLFLFLILRIMPYSYFYIRACVSLLLSVYIYYQLTFLFALTSINMLTIILDALLFVSMFVLFINYTINYYFDYVSNSSFKNKLEGFVPDINFIYLVLKKPIKLLPTITSLFGDPYSSISILEGSNWYCFRKSLNKKHGIRKSNIRLLLTRANNQKDRYVIYKVCINTKNNRNILEAIAKEQKPYDILKNNCVLVFSPLFKSLGIDLSNWYYKLPSIDVLKNKDKFIINYVVSY
jgi:hypothetical protein